MQIIKTLTGTQLHNSSSSSGSGSINSGSSSGTCLHLIYVLWAPPSNTVAKTFCAHCNLLPTLQTLQYTGIGQTPKSRKPVANPDPKVRQQGN
jgi:hypothetical protein